MEAFCFDHALAVEAEASLATVSGGLFFFFLIKDALFGSWRGREDEELAVGEDAVNVKEKEFDFAGARVGGEFRHRGDFSSLWRRAGVGISAFTGGQGELEDESSEDVDAGYERYRDFSPIDLSPSGDRPRIDLSVAIRSH
jgi:hypothetical protein